MSWRRAGLAAAALVLALAPLPATWVERWYSRGLYPWLQDVLTALSNLAPFALFDGLCLAAAAWFVWRLARDIGRRRAMGWGRVTLGVVLRLVTSIAVFYLFFLACWGLNYRRAPLTDRLVYDSARVSPSRARDLALVAVERANALYTQAHEADAPALDMAPLARSFAEAQRELGVAHPARPGRPKRTLLDTYFRLAAVDGMTDPYFLETLVVSDLLPFERPFVVAHEWAHLAGFADESEANFAGWLACVHGPSDEQYSGWLFLYTELAGGLRRADYVQVSARLANGPRQDLRAVSDRVRSHQNQTVSTAGWRVYDSYLKANRVQAGTASYAEVVKMILGTEFDAAWTPRLRP